MSEIRIKGPDGSSFSFPAGTPADVIGTAMRSHYGGAKPDTYQQPAPPPGVMIHEADRSFITGGGPEAQTKGMLPEDRNVASRALQARADTAVPGAGAVPFFQGLTTSAGDEAVSTMYGGAKALTGGNFQDAYNYAQEVQRQDLDQQRKDSPIASTVGQIAGGVTQGVGVGRALGAAGQGLSLAGRVIGGAGIGAGYGAFEGFASGSGLKDRASNVIPGAAIGAGVGAAVPLVSAAAGSLIQKGLDWRSVTGNLKQIGLDRPSGDTLMRALDADGAFGGTGARNIAAAGDDAMLADAGPTARAVLDTAMQRGGPATRVAREAVESRASGASARLAQALDQSLGRPEGVASSTAAIREGTKAARGGAYRAAYDTPIDYAAPEARDLEALLKRVPGKILAEANELMKLKGEQSRQIMADIADDGSVTFKRMPDVTQLDYITRALRFAAESGEGQGALGRQTTKGAAYEGLARDIRSTLKDLVPEYGRALDVARDPIERIAATKLGAGILNPQVARDEIAMQVQGMSRAELTAVRQGLRSQIDETLANVQKVASDPNLDAREASKLLNQLSSKAARDKIATILPPETASTLFRELDQASKAIELRAAVSRNSATYGRGAVDDQIKQANEPGPLALLRDFKPFQATQRLAQAVTNNTPQDQLKRNDETYKLLAEALTKYRGPEARRAMQALTGAFQAAPRNEALARLLGADLGTGTGLAVYQGSQRYRDR